jgi:hypothetical protein
VRSGVKCVRGCVDELQAKTMSAVVAGAIDSKPLERGAAADGSRKRNCANDPAATCDIDEEQDDRNDEGRLQPSRHPGASRTLSV